MLNLDPAKLLVIGVIALVVIGPERLPKFARQMGGVWRTLTSYREQAEEELKKVMPDVDLSRIPRSPKAAVSGYLTDLMRPTSTPSSGAIDDETEDDSGHAPTSDSGATTQGAQRAGTSSAGRPTGPFDDEANMN